MFFLRCIEHDMIVGKRSNGYALNLLIAMYVINNNSRFIDYFNGFKDEEFIV